MEDEILYQKFLSNGGNASLEEFMSLKTMMAQDETEPLKKKDDTQPIVESSSTDGSVTNTNESNPTEPILPQVAPPISQELEGSPMYQQEQNSLALASTEQPTSTELPSTGMESSGVGNSNISLPSNPIQNPLAQNLGQKINLGNSNIQRIDDFYNKRDASLNNNKTENSLDILAGKSNDIQGEINPKLATLEELAADEARSLEEGNQGRINADKQTQAFFDQYLNKDYIRTKVAEFNPAKPLWIDKNAVDLDAGTYVDQILEREKRGEVTVARNNEGQIIDKDSQPITDNSNILWQPKGKENIEKYNSEVRDFNAQVGEQNADKARFNLGNVGNEPEQDGFGEFVTKANKFGVIPTNEEYEQLTTDEARNEYLATLEATQNAQKNGTTLQQELDKVRPQYFLSDEVKIANGFDAVNLLNQGIESGDTKDQAELNYFTKFFSDKNNVMDFGEYWEREGKAKHKSSLVRENQANYQATRANIWNEYLSYKNDKLGTNQRFLEEAVVQSSALADRYAQEGNFQALESEKVKMENLYSQYEDNQGQMISVGNLYDESNKNFTTLANKRKEEADFQIKVQNGEVGANVKNILGQIPLAISTSITSTLTGIGRIASSVIPSDNLKDAVDITSDTELKVGNIKVASLTDKIKTFEGSDGFKYKEINGKIYGLKEDGTIFSTNYQQNGSETNIKEEVEYNGSGMVFLTAKMASDIYMTTGIGKGINATIGSSANRIANSTKVAQVFGEGSQMAKTASSFARLAKNADNVSVTGWYVQMYNDSYRMAEQGGISNPVNKHLYAITMSFMQSMIQRINPDTNFLKPLNTNARQVAKALISENPTTAKQIVSQFLKETADASIQFAKKAGNNVLKEVLEEVVQQGTQDISNLVLNSMGNSNLQTSTAQDYEEVVVGTIVPAAVASLLGGTGSRIANVNNKEIDLTTYSRNDLVTELARDTKGTEIINNFREGAFFQSQKDAAQRIEEEIIVRKKYVDKIPDVQKYSTPALSDVAPILQKIENKKADLKNDDGTFSERINKDIAVLTAQANAILDNDLNPNNNAENPQSTPQPEAVQTETNGTKTTIDLNAKTGDELYQTESTDNNLNQQDGSAPVQIESPNAEIKEDGQGSQEGRSIATDQLTEVGEGNQESEQVAAEIASQEEVTNNVPPIVQSTMTDDSGKSTAVVSNIDVKETEKIEFGSDAKFLDFSYNTIPTESVRITEYPDSETLKLIKDDIEKNGILKPISVLFDPETNEYSIKNGNHRLLAAKELGIKNIPVVVGIPKNLNISPNEKEKNSQQIPAESSEQFDNSSAKTSATGSQENINSQDPENEISEEELQQRNIAALQDILAKQKTESSPVENTAKSPKTVEAKPTETKSTILTKEEQGRNTLVGIKNDYNKLSAAKKNQTKGKEAFARINQLAKDLGYPIGSLGDGKISIKNPKTGKEMAKVKEVLSEKIPTPQEVESAKQYLGDVATWDGNVFNDHWESDLTWAEIRKGNQDIENGKLNTVPARRLVNEINRQLNDYGGFNFTKGSGAETEKTFISLQEIAQYKQEFPRVWTSLDLLTDQELENLYNERLESEKEFYTNGPSQSENNSVYEERQDLPSESSGTDQSQAELTSPEYKSLVTQRNDQEARVKTAKSKLDAVSKTTNKDFQGDQEDLFGERPAQQGLFDERADGKAGKELIATAKREYDQAKAELSRLNNAVRDFESGKVTGTESINFEEKKTQPVKSATPAEKIDDFGEKIGGAKKDFRANLENITDESLATQPLSKSFPRPDFKKLVDSKILTKEQAIFFNYLYDQIPAKPRKPYLLNAWTTKVKYVIDTFSSLMTDSDIDVVGRIRESATLGTKFKLYEDIYNEFGFPNNPVSMGGYEIKKLTNAAGEYFAIVKGSRIVSRDLYSVKEAVESLKAIIDKNKATKGDVKLSLYQDTKTKKYFIGKKGVFSTIRLIEFDDVKEGRSFLENNKEQLQEMWESQKETQKERDGKLNDPRIGTDYRKGEDVTPKKFSATFGFRGVEFGNYVNNNERQTALNEAYDAFMDLSTIIGVSPKALSLNGKLAMAFGARGSGNAMAHYEPTRVVINLTKTKGAGSLAHEWWHAFDNYLSGQRGKESEMLTDSPRYKGKDNTTVREEISDAFVNLVKTIKDSPLYKRSRAADAAKSKPYFSTSVEMTARAFENYVVLKMAEAGERNHYLANYNDHAIWAKNSRLSEDSYPYPLEVEAPGINKAYQDLFNILKEKKEGDNIALFQKTDEKFAEITPEVANTLIERLKKPFAKAFSNLNVTTDLDAAKKRAKELGKDITDLELRNQNGNVYGFKLPDGTIYINPNKLNANTPIHEFSHLWEQIMPNAWKKGLAIFKETSTGKKMFAQLQKEGNYSQLTEDQVWSEAMNTLIGNLGEQQYQRKPKGKMAEFIDWFKNAMSRFINTVTGKKELNKELDLNAFTDKVLGDLLEEKELVPESASSQQGDIQYSKIDLKNGAKKMIRDLVDLVKGKPGNSAEKRIFGKVTPEGAQYLSDLLGVNISDDFTHTIDRSSINHAHKNHGDIKIEESRGQIALTNEDYELAADIISTPDQVINTGKNEKGLQTVTYIKKFEDGTIVYIEEVRTGKKELALNSIRKMKGNIGIQQRYNDANKASNIPTPETTAASKNSLSTTNIPNLINFATDDVKNVLNEGNIDFNIVSQNKNIPAKTLSSIVTDIQQNGTESGFEKLQNSDWYQNLSDTEQSELSADNYVQQLLSTSAAQVKSVEKGKTTIKDLEQATQSRNKNLVTERIKPEKRSATKSVKKLSEIIADAAKNLKSTLIYGNPLSRKAAGTYNPSNTLIRIKNAGDLDTVAHELGHFIDDKYDFLGQLKQSDIVALDREIQWFAERGGSNPPAQLSPKMKAEYKNREGLAEFIRAYLFNPMATESIAPNLYKEFESILDDNAKESLTNFSEDLINFSNASNGDKITSNIQDSGLKNKESFLKFKKDNNGFGYSIFDKINANVFDSMSKANKAFAFINKLNGNDLKNILPENNFKVLHRVFAGVNGKIDKVLTKGMVDGKNSYILDSKGERMTMEWLLSPLDSTSEVTVREDMNEVIRLLVTQRTVEYAKKFQRVDSLTGIGAGIDSDLDIAKGFINDFNDLKNTNKEKFDRITEAARKYREYADAGLRYAVDKGRLAEEVLDKEGQLIGGYKYIKENNEYYVNLTRNIEITPLNEDDAFFGDTGSLTSAKEILKKSKGGTETIRNPYESLLMNTANMIKEADRNEIMASFFNPLKKMRSMGDGTPIDFAQIARPAGTSDKNVKTIYVNGIKERWQISADVIDAFNSLEGMSKDGFFLKILQFPAKVLRSTVTHFPVFAVRNVTRDTVSRAIMSRTGSGFKDMLHTSSDSDMFSLYGGSMAGYYGNGKEAYIKHLNSAVKKISNKGGLVINPLQKYSDFLQGSENINRIAEYKSAFRLAKKEGLDDYNAGLYAAFEARDLMDFAMSGVYIREINKYIPFLNAGVQGLVRVKKQVTERPITWAVKTAIYTLIPSLVASVIRNLNDDDEDYEELPAYQKDLFWNFRTPYTGNAWISIPKPYENGAVSALFDRTTSKIMGKDEAFDGLSGSLFQSLIPIDQSSWLGGFKPIIENMFNKDTFRGGTIVSQWEENKLKELRSGDVNASRIGQLIANGLYKTGYDLNPHKIDHLIKGYGTYFGDLTLKIGDVGVQNSRNKFTISQIGFAKDIPLSNAKTVSKVYDLAESLGETQNKDVKYLRTMIQGYYESSSDKEQLEMSREIYKVAKVILGNLEKEKGSKIFATDLANKRIRGEIQPSDVTKLVNTYIDKSKYVDKDRARNKIITDYNKQYTKLQEKK